MTNPLTSARDTFLATHPETRRRINGRDWGVIRTGNHGPALLLVPGTLGRADIFWQQIAALKSEAQILAVSYPDSGDIVDWADDLAQMIADEGFAGVSVLGSSLGGYLAQYLTATHPGLCAKLVAANTLAATDGIDQMPPYSLDLAMTPIDALRAGFEASLKSWLTADNPYADLAQLLSNEVNLRISEPELRARLQALKSAPKLPEDSLPQARVFTVESDDDHLITLPMRAALRAKLRPGRAFRFRAASHFPYVTRPDAYTAMLREVVGLSPNGPVWPAGEESTL